MRGHQVTPDAFETIAPEMQELIGLLEQFPTLSWFGNPEDMLTDDNGFNINVSCEPSAQGMRSLEVLAYACAGHQDTITMTAWFNGTEPQEREALCFEVKGRGGPDALIEELKGVVGLPDIWTHRIALS